MRHAAEFVVMIGRSLPARVRLRWLAPAALVLLVPACGQFAPSGDDPFAPMAGSVIGAAYTQVSERYLERPPMAAMALDGMRAVSDIDPSLKVVGDQHRIMLDRNGEVVRAYSAPAADDADGWAEVTTQLLEDARSASPRLHDTDPERIYAAVFDRALSHLDRFSRYATPAAAREERSQRDGFGGLGVIIDQDGAEIRITAVIEGTPASRLGIKAGDVLLAVDGRPIKGLPIDEVSDRLRGPVDSPVSITIAPGGTGAARKVALQRALIVPPTVSFKRYGAIGYIRIASFNQRTAASLGETLATAMRAPGLRLRGFVLDLRDNPGGLLDQAVDAADLFVDHGRILSTSGRHPDSNQVYDAAGTDLTKGLPLAVLVNGSTASAAEVLAAALQDLGRAVVIGTVSYGKGTVQTVHNLPNDGELVITWSRIHAPSGYVLNRVGVIPNVCTSDAGGDGPGAVKAVLETVKSGRLETAAARAALRANPMPDKSEIRVLRASCQPRREDPELDLAVAERLIENDKLMAHALLPAGVPEIAKAR